MSRPNAAAPAAPSLNAGDAVLLHGLTGSIELNECRGQLVEWIEQSGRWRVELDCGKRLAVKLENLKPEVVTAAFAKPPEAVAAAAAAAPTASTSSSASPAHSANSPASAVANGSHHHWNPIRSEAEYRTLVEQVAPRSLYDFVASLNAAGTPTETAVVSHMSADQLALWCSDEQVSAFLCDASALDTFVANLREKTLCLGMNIQKYGATLFGDAICIFPCIGCSYAYDHANSCCGGDNDGPRKIRPRMDRTMQDLAQQAHSCMLHVSLALSLVSWSGVRGRQASYHLVQRLSGEHGIEAARGESAFVQLMSRTMNVCALVGLIDNCVNALPKAALQAAGLLSALVAHRPAAVLSALDPVPTADALFALLRGVFQRIARSHCLVETRFGLMQLFDIIPLLYHLGDWVEAGAVLAPANGKSLLAASLGSLAVNLLHEVTTDDGRGNAPIDELAEHHPEVRAAQTRLHQFLGGAGESVRVNRPLTYAFACAVECIGRWHTRGGINVSAARVQAAPPPHLVAKLTAAQRRDYTESVRDGFVEYLLRMRDTVAEQPEIAFVPPIYEAIANGECAPLPPYDSSFLRGPLHVHMSCALPGCGRTTRCGDGGHGDEEDNEEAERRPLLMCAGGCGSLARYCSTAHQRAHWSHHKTFCKRTAK